jgi:hypothetical protein
MNTLTASNAVAEINRLHEEVNQRAATSREILRASLEAAWQAGQLLLAEKQSVRRRMGCGAWLSWLEQHFHGTPRTAQRYMKLAHTVADLTFLRGMSLRQAYARLGIATEPKTAGKRALVHTLPAHVLLANRLVRALNGKSEGAELEEGYRRDLRLLYERLRPWFENGSRESAAFTLVAGSRKP